MELVRWERQLELNRPILIAAFEGWNDAGDAASLALEHLAGALDAQRFASIDGEQLYDFTVTRPHVRLDEGGRRRIEWPEVELRAARLPGSRHDLILLGGVEPQLRWRAFASAVSSATRELGVEMAVMLGALLADVPHTRSVKVSGSTDDADLGERLGLSSSTYEGPTGIVGVLQDALRRDGTLTASFWAAVPHYAHHMASPKAALALVERAAAMLGVDIPTAELRAAAEEYEREVTERVADDEDAVAYVASLEQAEDAEWAAVSEEPLHIGNLDELAAEVERYLRDHHPER